MAENKTTIQRYDREALRQLEETFRNLGGSSGGSSGGNSARDENTEAVEDSTSALDKLNAKSVELSKVMSSVSDIAGSRGVQLMLDEFRSGLVGGVQALDGNMTSLKGAKDGLLDYADRTKETYMEMGISIKQLHEFNTQSRMASFSLGGFTQWQEKAGEVQDHYLARTGGYNEAMQHQTEMLNLLTYSGGEASDFYGEFGTQLDKTNDDLLKMGVTYEESRGHLKRMTEDENVRQRLMSAATKQQRLQIMLEVQERFKNLKAMGMSTEQAEAASKALAELSGKGPLDRIKESAKMQAGMAALGIENAQEVARIYLKGDRATPAERETMRAALGQLEEVRRESRMDSLGRELSVEAIVTRTGLDKLPAVFSEKLGAIGGSVEQARLDQQKILGIDTPIANKLVGSIDKLNTIMETSWLAEIPSTIVDLVAFGSKMGTATVALGTTAAVFDGVTAAMTGESKSWDMISETFPNAADLVASGVGTFVDGVKDFGGWASRLLESDTEKKNRDYMELVVEQRELRAEIGRNMTSLENATESGNARLEKHYEEQLRQSKRQEEQLETQIELAKKGNKKKEPFKFNGQKGTRH